VASSSAKRKRVRRAGKSRTAAVRSRRCAPETFRNRYVRAIEASEAGIWEWDVVRDRYFRSPRLCELFGYSFKEFPPTRSAVLERIHPDDRSAVEEALRDTFAGRAPYRVEFRIHRKDGSYRWVMANGMVQRNRSGRPLRFVGWMTDIDDRRRAEESVRESEEWFRSLIQLSTDFYWETDTAHRYSWLDYGRVLVLTRPGASQLGKAPWELPYTSPGAEEWEELRGRMDRRETFRDFVFARSTEEGEERWRSISGEPRFAHDGRFLGYRGIGRDVTDRRRAEAALRDSEERFRRLTELSSDWYWEQDEHYRFTYTSGGIQGKTGSSPAQVIGKARWEIPAPNMTDSDWSRHRAQLERRQPFKDLELQRTYGNGLEYWASVSGEPVFDTYGRFKGYRGTARDITRRKLAEERLRATLEGTPDVAIQWYDANCRVVYWNPASERLYGIARDEALGKSPSELSFEAEGAAALRDAITEAGATGRAFGPAEYSYRRRDVTQGIVQATVFPLPSVEGGPRFVCMAVDVTERKLAEKRLVHLAQHDTLTGLPNRTLFRDRLLQALAQASRNDWKVGVLFIDLDRFKVVNDTLGHNSGDRLLRTIARQLQSAMRAGDTMARLGGDEFAVILPDMRHEDVAGHVAQKLLDILAEPVHLDKREMFIGGSIGITVAPTDGSDPDILLRNADTAMYRAKERGRGMYQYFTPAMNERAQRVLELEQSLRRAVERHEFVLHYEPRVHAADGNVVGIEALLRWMGPDGSVVLPAEFIAVLEETGLIVPVGEWVLREACAQLVAWKRKGLGSMRISVNVSARQFHCGDIAAAVKAALAASGALPSDLELELTESTLMHDTEASRAALAELKALGVRVSVDDFGTGYSSLAYLKRFAIGAVKIDRSFIRDVPADPNDSAIVTAIVGMAHTLGLRAVAEGVELASQAAFLVGCGCDELQGYLISRPRPAAEMESFLLGESVAVAA
jgi:diguanylate cyclase (GGDEF)-like protein/PAS domain S-box-containing protein